MGGEQITILLRSIYRIVLIINANDLIVLVEKWLP